MTKLTGQCHCGKNKFEVNAEPEFQFVCHCTDCRVLNGGGHLCGMMFDDSQLVKAQHLKTYRYPGGSGHPIIIHFCPECSTALYGYPTNYKDKVVVRANVLNDANFKPQKTLFSESAFGWDKP